MKVHIATLIMAKNEEKRIKVTLDSVVNVASSIVIYDTGSTDNTLNIAKEFCENNNIPLRLKQGEFVDFATSRNVSLDFADEFIDIDFILLLDVNDELRGGNELKNICKKLKEKTTGCTGYLLCQEWYSGDVSKYYNMRLIKARSGWRYVGVVHEWLSNFNGENRSPDKIPDTITIYQDRTQDCEKSGKRFITDRILLEKEHLKNPTEPRTLFYLAQTCGCIKDNASAYRYYKLRVSLEGFYEERYYSMYKCGELTEKLNHPWEVSLGWYMKAYETIRRVEPLLKIAEHYISIKQWDIAFHFLNLSIQLEYPLNNVLFVDKKAYDYKRWHLLGIVGFYCKKMVEGKNGCIQALKNQPESEIDKQNLKFYK